MDCHVEEDIYAVLCPDKSMGHTETAEHAQKDLYTVGCVRAWKFYKKPPNCKNPQKRGL